MKMVNFISAVLVAICGSLVVIFMIFHNVGCIMNDPVAHIFCMPSPAFQQWIEEGKTVGVK